MIVLFTIFLFLVSLVIFHLFLVKRDSLSDIQCEGIDYLWYGFGALALFLVTIDVTRLHDIELLEKDIKYSERAQFEIEYFINKNKEAICKDNIATCNLLTDTVNALNETIISLGWPLGPVVFNKQEYRSWNLFLKERGEFHNATVV